MLLAILAAIIAVVGYYDAAGVLALAGIGGIFAAIRLAPMVKKRVGGALFLGWLAVILIAAGSFVVSGAAHAISGPVGKELSHIELRRSMFGGGAFVICWILVKIASSLCRRRI